MTLKDFIKVNDSNMEIRLFMNEQNITANGISASAKEIIQYENYEIRGINFLLSGDTYGSIGSVLVYLKAPEIQ